MSSSQDKPIPAGWIGGFAQSDPTFAYPNPDLTSLPLLDNMDNIKLLDRQQGVKWPEFSWQTIQGNEKSRCFQMFAPYISRLGYTNKGRIYSIICPQQGACSPNFGCMNVEVTVTGQRGWADETTKKFAADMTVEGKIWFSPSVHQSQKVKNIWRVFNALGLKFPSTKENAIVVTTHKYQDPSQPIFPVRDGETTLFKSPEFARHEAEAWHVGNIEVQIGPIKPTASKMVNDFNELVMFAFNTASGNMLQNGNLLTWNVWFTQPELVNREEWATHAERWRKSIDADHGSPTGSGTEARYFDGTLFKPADAFETDMKGVMKTTIQDIDKKEESKLDSFYKEYIEDKL
ncbi:hypothetical protein IMCC3317_41740 [Kordia antarctica]|uniref:Uncharacterized protein n=1 Tax=Kordia antarctica TaxID=1218801 RepID=A0A7L4ZSU6_9FLAO|nr:hypothetical protein [Kordia antarctica]QHI38774.1 hypothetical protein IMCC3317_41740 [Kordia antarctica]